jgi:glycine dehydrogenase
MLQITGHASLDSLIDAAVPGGIRMQAALDLPGALPEHQALAKLKEIMGKNRVMKSFIGQGYHGTHTPGVIQRNILENPGWYTAYTPYQAEIAQGRLEALLNFQTMITDLTGLDVANASLLDEGTAAAEAMSLALAGKPKGKAIFRFRPLPSADIDVVVTRAEPLGIEVITGDWQSYEFPADGSVFAVLVQYPDTRGRIDDFAGFFAKAKAAGAVTIVAADLLALTLLKAPGDFRCGNLRRFLTAFRRADGIRRSARRIHGLHRRAQAQDARPPDRRVHRLARQTRLPALAANPRTTHPPRQGHLQHLHRAGPARRDGLDVCRLSWPGGTETNRARSTLEGRQTRRFAHGCGHRRRSRSFLRHHRRQGSRQGAVNVQIAAAGAGINLRLIDEDHIGISIDETSTDEELAIICRLLAEFIETAKESPLPAGLAAPPPSSPRRFSTVIIPRPRCCATSSASKARTSRSTSR